MRGDLTAVRLSGSRRRKDGLKRLSFVLVWGRKDVPPLLSGIDSDHDGSRMKAIAVEAFGRHLKGADASTPLSFGGFPENPEKPKSGILPAAWDDFPVIRETI